MNKLLGIALLLVVALLGGWWLSSKPSTDDKTMMGGQAMMETKPAMEKDAMGKDVAPKADDAMMKKDDTMMPKDGAMMDKSMDSMMMGGQYVAYDASKLAFAKEGKVVLFFRASWCPTCRTLDADIRANLSQIPKNVLILDVDYDKSAELKKQYGVTYQHTLVQVDADGKMITKWSGSEGLKQLLQEVK